MKYVITSKVRSGIYLYFVHQLGLMEKDVLSHNFEIQFSDPSDANTNSTTLISDDTDDKPSTVPNSKSNKSNYPECEVRSF